MHPRIESWISCGDEDMVRLDELAYVSLCEELDSVGHVAVFVTVEWA